MENVNWLTIVGGAINGALSGITAGNQAPPPPPEPKKDNTLWYVLGGLGFLVIVILAFFAFKK